MRFLSLLLIWTLAATHAAGDETRPLEAERQIRARAKQWVEMLPSRDEQAVARLYTSNGVMMPPGQPIAEGRPAVAEVWGALFRQPGFELTFEPTRVTVSKAEDMAYEIGTYDLAFMSSEGPVHETGKYVVVWQKEAGAWRAAVDIFNSNGNPEQ